MKKILFLLLLIPTLAFPQSEDEVMIKSIFDKALSEGQSHEMLRFLTKEIGARLSGSPEAAAAVEWSRQTMTELKFDEVILQEVMVPHWVRGKREVARISQSSKWGSVDLNVRALGNSVGTGPEGVSAKIIEVQSLSELETLGKAQLEGKIVFFNRPMDPTLINTFSAYGGAVDQRGSGASEAAKYGAIGVIVRSMASNIDDFPHTGSLRYQADQPKIPAVAISTSDAEFLSKVRKGDPEMTVYFETHCMQYDDVLSYNVVGELKGTSKNSYIVVGGHLDSWDLGEGAHDDGAGCVQAIEAVRILKELGYQPKNNLRAVMFMNEENGLKGGRRYAELALKNKEKHIVAIESDRGGFVPRGFSLSMTEKQKGKIEKWQPLLLKYGIGDLSQAGGGADIGPLAEQGVPLMGFLPDSQRYFNYHHTDADVFEAVDKRELELGAATMAVMIYLIDKYGL
ncbi:MAG: M20/M25/M40 family metallo-hydrolase [Cyclobacteriaceae bacterium]|nr:M20/M25/M40 family metallo-hydrolase [Cyclobacteriaceae bacterium]